MCRVLGDARFVATGTSRRGEVRQVQVPDRLETWLELMTCGHLGKYCTVPPMVRC